jgi:hypothetical protein
VAIALALAAAPVAAQDVRDALGVGDLICEFGRDGGRSLVAELAGAPAASDLLLVYEAVTRDSAQVLSTRVSGRRPVRVRATGKAVHFIERVGPSVRVTTLTSCELRKARGGSDTCVRYAARHAWHFDDRVLADPDLAFTQLPSGAASGQCEPWQVE